MSQTAWVDLVEAVHASEYQAVVAVTGGGSKAISQLADVAGASRTMLEAIVPYGAAALTDWLNGTPEQFCSEPTARSMAMAAWTRACRLAPDVPRQRLLGIGATASLATDRPKRGEHRIHVGVQSTTSTTSYSLRLAKDERNRKKEQWLAAKLILLAVGQACRVDTSACQQALSVQLHEPEQITTCRAEGDLGWAKVLSGQQPWAAACPAVEANDTDVDPPQVVFPGAFNPPHNGHRRMAAVAAKRTGRPVTFELSITNVDKRPLDYVQLEQRLAAFQKWDPHAKLVLTEAPVFGDKAAVFPGCTFVVGADTMSRIAAPKYYGNSLGNRDAALENIGRLGCRFLVFGRQWAGGFQQLGDLDLPAALSDLCDEVPESEFREDISSTQLRSERSEP